MKGYKYMGIKYNFYGGIFDNIHSYNLLYISAAVDARQGGRGEMRGRAGVVRCEVGPAW